MIVHLYHKVKFVGQYRRSKFKVTWRKMFLSRLKVRKNETGEITANKWRKGIPELETVNT